MQLFTSCFNNPSSQGHAHGRRTSALALARSPGGLLHGRAGASWRGSRASSPRRACREYLQQLLDRVLFGRQQGEKQVLFPLVVRGPA